MLFKFAANNGSKILDIDDASVRNLQKVYWHFNDLSKLPKRHKLKNMK